MLSPSTERTIVRDNQVATRDLLVLWQHPETRAIEVVGRLQFDGEAYTFGYTNSSAAVFAAGFRGLPGLRDPSCLYRSEDLFKVFAQRSLDPARADYSRHLEQLGLDEEATPLEQIVRSGGRRVADTIQLLEVPREHQGLITSTFLAHGVRHVPKKPLYFTENYTQISGTEHERAIGSLKSGGALGHRLEQFNKSNPQATVLTSPAGTPVGYIPNVLVAGVRTLIDSNAEVRFTTIRVNGPDAPPHLRLLVRLSASNFNQDVFDNFEWKFRADGGGIQIA